MTIMLPDGFVLRLDLSIFGGSGSGNLNRNQIQKGIMDLVKKGFRANRPGLT